MRLQAKFLLLVASFGVLFSALSFAVLFALHNEVETARDRAEIRAQAERAYRLLQRRLGDVQRLVQARVDALDLHVPPTRERAARQLADGLPADVVAALDVHLLRVFLAEDAAAAADARPVHAVTRARDGDLRAAAAFDAMAVAAVQLAAQSPAGAPRAGLVRLPGGLYEAVVVPARGRAPLPPADRVVGYVVAARHAGDSTAHDALTDLFDHAPNSPTRPPLSIEALPLAEARERGMPAATAATAAPAAPTEWEPGRVTDAWSDGHGLLGAGVAVTQLGVPEPLWLTVQRPREGSAMLPEVLALAVTLATGGLLLMAATIGGLRVLVVRRLQRLARYAERVRSPGDLGRRPIEDATNDEIGQLYRSVDLMLDRIEDQATTLRLTNQELVAALQAKDEFFNGISHELRTPLATIAGFLDRLEAQLGPAAADDGGPAQAVRKIKRSARHLLQLIDELLELSRARAGKLPFRLGPTDVVEALADVRALMQQQAASKGLELVVAEPSHEVPAVRADHRRLVQVLVNLVENAIKYSTRGRVTIEVEEVPAEHVVRLVVADQGPGIEPTLVARLFEPFTRGDSTREPGAGLGLALVQEFLQRMHGHIAVASRPGHGSRFVVSLPIHAAWAAGHRPRYTAAAPFTSG